jgi:integrase
MGLYCVSKLVLDKHLIPFLGKTPIDSITSLQIEKYKAQKSNEGLKNKTINNHLTILHKCLRDAKEWLDLEMIPKIKKLKVDPSKTDFLIQEECELLLRNTDGIWYEMILVALKTGIRFGELRALKWSDINWDTRILTVRCIG